MTQCGSWALMGPQCDLEQDHEGKHRHTYETGRVFKWTDEGTKRAMRDWEAKGGGWD